MPAPAASWQHELGEDLVVAAKRGYDGRVRQLLAAGADPNHVSCDGDTALLLASDRGLLGVARLLLDGGADPNLASEAEGDSPLFWAASSGRAGVVVLLLRRGAEVNHTDHDGFTAVLTAAAKGRLDVVQLLMAWGADRTRRNVYGADAYRAAFHNGSMEVLEFLDAVDGWSPLRIAVGLRLHTLIAAAMRMGKLAVDGGEAAALLATAAAAGPWTDAPGLCAATATIARRVLCEWAPRRHGLYHRGVRSAIRSVLLVTARLKLDRGGSGGTVRGGLVLLPPEIWMAVMSFFGRPDWPAP